MCWETEQQCINKCKLLYIGLEDVDTFWRMSLQNRCMVDGNWTSREVQWTEGWKWNAGDKTGLAVITQSPTFTNHHQWKTMSMWWLIRFSMYLGIKTLRYACNVTASCAEYICWRRSEAGARCDVIEWRACTASWMIRRWAAYLWWEFRSAFYRQVARRTSALWPEQTRSVTTVVAAATYRSASAGRDIACVHSPRAHIVTFLAGSQRVPYRTDHMHLQTQIT